MLNPEQIPDKVVKAAALRQGATWDVIIAAAINAWPGSYSLTENDSAEIRDVAVIILPLPKEPSDD